MTFLIEGKAVATSIEETSKGDLAKPSLSKRALLCGEDKLNNKFKKNCAVAADLSLEVIFRSSSSSMDE